MNMVLAAMVLWGVYATRGVPSLRTVSRSARRSIGRCPGWPAEKAGLQRGDKILVVDGVAVAKWEDLVAAIFGRPGREVRIEFERAGERQEVTLTTRSEKRKERTPRSGRSASPRWSSTKGLGIGESFVTGWVATWAYLERTAEGIGRVVTRQASVKEFAGPVGIAKMTGEVSRQGPADLLEFLAIISVNIGFVNILPIPALDGGHLIMVLIEG